MTILLSRLLSLTLIPFVIHPSYELTDLTSLSSNQAAVAVCPEFHLQALG